MTRGTSRRFPRRFINRLSNAQFTLVSRPKAKAEAVKSDSWFDNSLHHLKTEFNNFFYHAFAKQSAKENTSL